MRKITVVAPGRPYDLLGISLILVASVLLSFFKVESPVLWVLAFLSVYFVPGYALVSLIFPSNKVLLLDYLLIKRKMIARNISILERFALSFALSLSIMAISGIILLNFSDFDSVAVWIELLIITMGASVFAIVARSRLPPDDQIRFYLTLGGKSHKFNRAERLVAVLIVIGIVSASALLVNGILYAKQVEPYTEFFITGPEGSLSQLPSVLGVLANGTVLINIVNHEGKSVTYNVTVGLTNDSTFDSYHSLPFNNTTLLSPKEAYSARINLQNEASVDRNFTFSVGQVGDYRLYFRLQGGERVEELWLWLHIQETV